MFHRHDGGKGDKPILPQDKEKYDNNWDAIFKKKKDTCNGFCGVTECNETPQNNCKRVAKQYPCEVIRPTDNK